MNKTEKSFIASRPILQEILKEVFQANSKWSQAVIKIHLKKQSTDKGNYVITKSMSAHFSSSLTENPVL